MSVNIDAMIEEVSNKEQKGFNLVWIALMILYPTAFVCSNKPIKDLTINDFSGSMEIHSDKIIKCFNIRWDKIKL